MVDQHDATAGNRDNMVDTPPYVKRQGAKVENDLLLRGRLGVNIRGLEVNQIADRIAQNINTQIGLARFQMTQRGLQEMLEDSIGDKFHSIHDDPRDPQENQRAMLVTEALRETLSPEILKALTVPVSVRAANSILPKGTFETVATIGGTSRRITINLLDPFWIKIYYPNESVLERSLVGKTLKELGMKVEGTRDSYKLSVADVTNLLTLNFLVIPETGGIPTNQRIFFLSTQFRIANDMSNLFEGTENYLGATIAASVIDRNPELRNVLSIEDKAKENLTKAEDAVHLQKLLDNLEKAKVPTGKVGKQELQHKLADIENVSGGLTNLAIGTTINIGTTPIQERYKILPNYNSRSVTPIADTASAMNWLEERRKETLERMEAFEDIEEKMRPVIQFVRIKGIAGTKIDSENFIDALGVVNDAKFKLDLNIKELIDDVKKKAELEGKSLEDLEKKVVEESENVKKSKSGKGAPQGDQAQQLVIKEHFRRYKGMSDVDAQKATNYLLGRSLLDGDVTKMGQEFVTEKFGGHVDSATRSDNLIENIKSLSPGRQDNRNNNLLREVAHAAGVHMHEGSEVIDWNTLSYPALATAFFTLKKMYKGDGLPAALKLQPTKNSQAQLQAISRILVTRHAVALLEDVGPGVSDTKKEEIKKAPTKLENIAILEGLLEGDPPEHYGHKIDHIIHHVDRRTSYLWRTFFKGETNSAFIPISAPNLLWRNKYASLKGLYWNPLAWAAKKTFGGAKKAGSVAKERAGNATKGALIGTLFMPGLGTIVGAGVGALIKKKEGGGAAAPAHH